MRKTLMQSQHYIFLLLLGTILWYNSNSNINYTHSKLVSPYEFDTTTLIQYHDQTLENIIFHQVFNPHLSTALYFSATVSNLAHMRKTGIIPNSGILVVNCTEIINNPHYFDLNDALAETLGLKVNNLLYKTSNYYTHDIIQELEKSINRYQKDKTKSGHRNPVLSNIIFINSEKIDRLLRINVDPVEVMELKQLKQFITSLNELFKKKLLKVTFVSSKEPNSVNKLTEYIYNTFGTITMI
jgi:hypothetical protein